MLSIRSLLAVLAFACTFLPSSAFVCGQEAKSEPLTSVSDSAALLRRVVFSHPGCVTCNDSILDKEEQYLNRRVKERARVESIYEQNVVDDTKQALEDFWRDPSTRGGMKSEQSI